MSKKAFTIKVDEQLINEFKNFALKVGITPTAAISMFMKECLKEEKIPFRPKI